MARNYSTQEVVDILMQSDSEDLPSSPAEEDSSSPADDSGDDSEDSSVHSDQLESSSKSSSGDESEGETHDEAAGWTTKNGKIVWSPTNAETLRYFPAATGLTPGPTHYAAARIIDPISSFMLFLTDEIVQHIVAMTNLHGRRTMKAWRDLDADELRAYVGLIVLAGVYRSKHESTESLWSEKSGRSIFRATMSHKRFRYISRAMRFDNKLSRRHDDKFAAFRQVWDLWTSRLIMLFNPDQDLTVDEQLVPFKGRCGFRQYMPKKPAKYGIKIWAACDTKTSYAWRLQVYTGKAAGAPPEVNQGMRVVLQMTEGLQGHVITCDNFFTSYALAEELLKRKLALVGTIRQYKPEIPPALRQARGREIYSSIFAFTKKHTLVSYIPRRGKNVLLLSTKHRSPDVTDGDKRKPVIIEEYNRCKGGVDNLDKVVGTYTCRRRTRRWPMALFHNMIDVSLYNAYVLWISVDPSWQQQKSHRRRLYIEEVGESLVKPHMIKRVRLPRSSAAAEMVTAERDATAAGPSVPIQSRDRKQCELCCNRRRRIGNICSKCGRFICRDHSQLICGLCST
ncbi:piggyBac transposable element-derived protein 4-like [Oreochromis aureus]|uniref:piggyBac transposable element-derived protein 4-like n=1 Tax=Oreochromis aureus TaxID=47969 RepID=UPI0012BCE474|nr:piggyBac transposable element-derived protein 4-like [Oreochromis aureus]